MPTYVRNIYEILEVTPDTHSERKSLESILYKLQEAQSYNHYLDEGESIRHTLEIERLIDGGCIDLLDGEQTFIRHGMCVLILFSICLLYTSPSPRDKRQSRMPSSA